MIKPFFISIALAIIFFIISFLTLADYGPSWDETIHFRRGQAYIHYFLTGEKNYNSLAKVDLQGTNGDPAKVASPRRSFYQSDIQNGEYFLNKDIGHPPLNDELAAFLNYIFYQKLGVLDDISSHHLFNILVSSLLVFVTTFFTFRYFGFFPSLITFLTLSTYPLFWAESHFNVKDPAEAAFFSTTLLCLILSLEKKSKFWLIVSAATFGLGLGTKFNILFLPFIILPYGLIAYRQKLKDFKKTYFLSLLAFPLIVGFIFLVTWPYLWQDSPKNLLNIFNFYRAIGTSSQYQPEEFFILGFNTYPIQWIIFTSPLLVLILSLVGVVSAWINRNLYNKITILFLLWLFIPILRVSFPGTTIYGGIRQILEFLPALAIISGLGVWQITQWLKKSPKYVIVMKVSIIVAFLWPLIILIKLHPYQNVYFNSLIGGLKGAYVKDFPSWGNTLGSAYKGGIDWINAYAPENAKLTLIQGTPSNAPPILLRKDINYLADGNIDPKFTHFSGINREGEYIMEVTFSDSGRDFHYTWEYVENFLSPVYELKSDGVSILKIWKNDLEHTKDEFKLKETEYKGSMDVKVDKEIMVNLGDVVFASRLGVLFNNENCSLSSGFIETSVDGRAWQRERDIFPQYQVYQKLNLTDSKLEYFFPSRKLKYIRVVPNGTNPCILRDPQVKITIL